MQLQTTRTGKRTFNKNYDLCSAHKYFRCDESIAFVIIKIKLVSLIKEQKLKLIVNLARSKVCYND